MALQEVSEPISAEFIKSMTELLGDTEGESLIKSLNTPSTTSVRCNRAKPAELPFEGERVEWCDEGMRLNSRPTFTLMPELHAGAFYVQEASSMIMTEAVKRVLRLLPTERALRYLDACAAPGGKTTAAIAALPDDALVVANEYDSRRASILVENIVKWGAPNVIVTNSDTKVFRRLPALFDVVAVDAPCSGEGMMRKEAEARRQWSPSLVRQCSNLQKEIIDNVWVSLKPGGYLIYSTCTFNLSENEEMVHYITNELGGESIDIGLNADYNIPTALSEDITACRFMPHKTQGEGLFLSIIKKPDSCNTSSLRQAKKGKQKEKGTKIADNIKNMLAEPEKYIFKTMADGNIHALPKEYESVVSNIEAEAHIISAGICMGVTKGKDLIPSHQLALSTALNRNYFPSVELDKETALRYLRRDAIALSPDAPRGIVLLTYKGLPLGFGKNLGNRCNNLYPQAWRIRLSGNANSGQNQG